jgi:uncharacterized protein (DUF1501 family)
MPITRRDFCDPSRPDENVLVVVFLRGGADGLTLVAPVHDETYRRLRPTLAVAAKDGLPLDDVFALHPALAPLHARFESGEMAVTHGVGTDDESRSHFVAQDWMEHGGATGAGWLARYLRRRDAIPAPLCAVAIGTTLPESLRGAPGGAVIQTIRDFALGDDDGASASFTDDLARLYAFEDGDLGSVARDTIEAIRRLRQIRAQADVPADQARYPDTEFGRGMREIARLVRARVGLVASTIDLGGWDSHFAQTPLIAPLMRELAEGVDAFLTDLGDERSRVTVAVMTEFGRRVGENSSLGTDHGLASVMLTFGVGVRGGMRSTWRRLDETGFEGPGDIPVTIDYREVMAPILAAHAPHVDLRQVFPGSTIVPGS